MNRIEPAPGQESVWDYPRPPLLEPTTKRIEVYFNGIKIADTRRAFRVLETSHPPVYYIPPEDIQTGHLEPSAQTTFCEWKGRANYFDLQVNDRTVEKAAWYYPEPNPAYLPIRDHLAFYPQKMDVCTVDGEKVIPQPGAFYGGWITSDIVGPFKGAPGSVGW